MMTGFEHRIEAVPGRKMYEVARVADALEMDEAVNIAGFVPFTTRHLAARQRRNPRTGNLVSVPARGER